MEAQAESEPDEAPRAQHRFDWRAWGRDLLRVQRFAAPVARDNVPGPWQLLAIATGASLLQIAVSRLEVQGPAVFNYRFWLATWWPLVPILLLAWSLSATQREAAAARAPVVAWLALWFGASMVPQLVAWGLFALWAREQVPAADGLQWAVMIGLYAWMGLICLACARAFLSPRRAIAMAAGVVAFTVASSYALQERVWYAEEVPDSDEAPRFKLSQESFEQQQGAWADAITRLRTARGPGPHVYGLVYAPYAGEDVFLRESTLVAQVLEERFEARGRVLQMVNHASTNALHPWATPLNLRRGIELLAQRMDRDRDVLVVYLTSHGGADFKLSANHWPLQVPQLTAAAVREALDAAGVRNRVVAVSACYSGGWVQPLESDGTLVMTAADATHTSYGCGRKSDLTFFGRAMFDEQLRRTHSFEAAFQAAVPVIRQREIEGKKADGFSNPQISVGAGIRPVLQALERRLGKSPNQAAAKP